MALQKRVMSECNNNTVRVVMVWDDKTGVVSGFEITSPKENRVELTADSAEGKDTLICEKADLTSSLISHKTVLKVGRWPEDPDQKCEPYLLGHLPTVVGRA